MRSILNFGKRSPGKRIVGKAEGKEVTRKEKRKGNPTIELEGGKTTVRSRRGQGEKELQ